MSAGSQEKLSVADIVSMPESDIIKNFGIVQDQITKVTEQLRLTILPVIERINLNEATQKSEFETAMKSLAGLEARLQKSVNPIITGWDGVKDNVETYRLELQANRKQHEGFEEKFKLMFESLATLRSHVDTQNASTNGQMGTLLATQSSRLFGDDGGGGSRGGDGKANPLVTNRLFDNLGRLSGNEDHAVMDDWYDEVERNFELLMPHSAKVLQWAHKSPDTVDFELMNGEQNPGLVMKISRELYALLMNKTEDKAKSHVKILTPQDGLEAWRSMRMALSRRDGQRLQAEFDALTTQLKPVPMSELKNLSTLLAKWEKELKDFEALDKEYKVGQFQRRQIIFKILPEEVKRMCTYQQGMGQLAKYEEFLSFIKTIASSSMYQSWKQPTPLTAGTNLLAPVAGGCVNFGNQQFPSQEAEIKYSYDECVAWVSTPEGEKYVNENDVTDPTLVQAIFAVAKGKGKNGGGKNGRFGGGKNNANPKGGSPAGKREFQGECHKCHKWGHRINECPLWKDAGPNKSNKGGGKGGKGGVHLTGDEHSFHFMITDDMIGCGMCMPESEEAPLPGEIPGAKWFVNVEQDVEVDGNEFPELTTASDESPIKSKMGPIARMSQKETRKVANAARLKEDNHWFSTSSISSIKGTMNTTAQKDSVERRERVQDDEVRECKVEDVEERPADQSFMNFMNTKIAEVVDPNLFCGFFTDVPPDQILEVKEGELVWTCVAVAVDTGSCANVTPPGVFGIEIAPSEASKSKKPFFGADKSPIKNLGNQSIKAICEEGHKMSTTFAVADKLSRPLASGYEITEAGNELSMWKGGGHIKCKKSGATTALRQEGKLWFLDLWVQVPSSISSSGFARPS